MNAILLKIKNIKNQAAALLNTDNPHLFSCLFGMLGASIIFMMIHIIEKPSIKLGTVNITGMVDHFIKQESEKNIQGEVLKKEVRQFGSSLDKELQRFSKENGIVLMPSEAIIAGTEDYTSLIYQKMQTAGLK